MMPLSSGEIVGVNISGVHAGQSGSPGELRGTFTDNNSMGHLTCNSEMGIFGSLNYPCIESAAIPMAHMQEVQPGPATILSTISGSYPQEFEIVIDKINYMDATATKNMVIRVTDPRLLGSTGGIVQGMSGSPIIQNEMLVGAVTHVFVNDPTRGYAIFAEKMDSQLETVELSGNVA
jgi:stage IV sporulation protein B